MFSEFLIEVLIPWILIVFLLVFVGTLAVNQLEKYSCNKYMEITGIETKHEFLIGCFIKHKGKFIPYDEFNSRNLDIKIEE